MGGFSMRPRSLMASKRRNCGLLASVLLALSALASPALARAANVYGPVVDDRVAAAADADPVATDYLNLIVTGSEPGRAVRAVKGIDLLWLGGPTVSAQ